MLAAQHVVDYAKGYVGGASRGERASLLARHRTAAAISVECVAAGMRREWELD